MGSIHFESTYDNSRLINGINQDNRTVGQWAKNMEAQGKGVEQTFKNVVHAAEAYISLRFAAQLGSEIIKVRGEFQQLGIAFETMLGSKAKADQLMQEAIAFSQKTPFTLTDVASNIKQLMAMGIATDDVMTTMKSLGDVAAGVSVPISRLAINYGQVATLGKLQTRELRDFAMAGVPLIDELAKNYNKTKNEIQDMVTAGQIGFKDVEKAFQTMAGEGGKFFNLMEKQNKSVTGQISNLQDKVQVMLNSIGQANEGLIYKGISGITTLVTHYQEILDILKVLVATYGAYKAAVIAASVAQKLMMFAENVQLVAMFRKELGLATAAQQAFNLKAKANPYGLILAGLTAVISALVIFTKRQKDAYVAGSEYGKSLTEEKEKLKGLFDAITKTKEGTEERNIAVKDANDSLKTYNISLTDEKGNLVDLKQAYKDAESAIDNYVAKQAKARELTEAGNILSSQILQQFQQSQAGFGKLGVKLDSNEIKDLQGFVKNNADLIKEVLVSRPAGYAPTDEEISKFELFQAKLKEAIGSSKTLSDINAYDTQSLQSFLRESADQLTLYRDRVKEIDTFYDAMIDTNEKAEVSAKTVKQQIEETVEAISTAQAKLKDMRKGSSTSTAQEISDQETIIKELKSNLEKLTGMRKKDIAEQEKSEEKIFEWQRMQLDIQEKISEVLAKRVAYQIESEAKTTWKDPSTGIIKTGNAKPDTITEPILSKSVDKIYITSLSIKETWAWIMSEMDNPGTWENITKGFGELSNAFAGINDDLSKFMGDLGNVAASMGSVMEGKETGNGLQVLTSGLSVINEVGKVFDEIFTKDQDITNEIEAQTEFLERQLEIANKLVGIEKQSALQAQAELYRASIASDKSKLGIKGDVTESDLNVILTGLEQARAGLKENSNTKRMRQDYDNRIALVKDLLKNMGDLYDLEQQINEQFLTGTTGKAIADDIAAGFMEGKHSVEDFAKTTEEVIKKALITAFRAKFIDQQMSDFYKSFTESAKGGLTAEEILSNKTALEKIMADANLGFADYEKLIASMGGVFGEGKSAGALKGLTGSIQNMTEQTGSELAGVMRKTSDDTRAIRDYTKMGISHLVNIEANTYNATVELKSAVTELKAINVNTKQSSSGRDLGT